MKTYVYECEGGYSFVVRLGDEKARLFLPGRTLELPRVQSASGEKYQKGDATFWAKGEEARLEMGGKTYRNCRSNPAKAVWEDARLRGVDFRATGNEPGWYLEISEGERILLVADYGEKRLVTPAPAPEVDPRTSRTRYQVRTEAHALTIVLKPGPCSDSMSGAMFPTRVSVSLDGREYRGCGRALGAGTAGH